MPLTPPSASVPPVPSERRAARGTTWPPRSARGHLLPASPAASAVGFLGCLRHREIDIGMWKKKRYGGFHSHGGTPIAGWFMRGNLAKMDDRKPPYRHGHGYSILYVYIYMFYHFRIYYMRVYIT